jgi:hypothetical protein
VSGADARLDRLVAADGRYVDVAVDNGLFGECAFLTSLEHMPRTTVAAGDHERPTCRTLHPAGLPRERWLGADLQTRACRPFTANDCEVPRGLVQIQGLEYACLVPAELRPP